MGRIAALYKDIGSLLEEITQHYPELLDQTGEILSVAEQTIMSIMMGFLSAGEAPESEVKESTEVMETVTPAPIVVKKDPGKISEPVAKRPDRTVGGSPISCQGHKPPTAIPRKEIKSAIKEDITQPAPIPTSRDEVLPASFVRGRGGMKCTLPTNGCTYEKADDILVTLRKRIDERAPMVASKADSETIQWVKNVVDSVIQNRFANESQFNYSHYLQEIGQLENILIQWVCRLYATAKPEKQRLREFQQWLLEKGVSAEGLTDLQRAQKVAITLRDLVKAIK